MYFLATKMGDVGLARKEQGPPCPICPKYAGSKQTKNPLTKKKREKKKAVRSEWGSVKTKYLNNRVQAEPYNR
jgi:hypothetical protein